jgi:hypothetical protein
MTEVETARVIKQIQAQTQRDLIARKAMAQAPSDYGRETDRAMPERQSLFLMPDRVK